MKEVKYILLNEENIAVYFGKKEEFEDSREDLRWEVVPLDMEVEIGWKFLNNERRFIKNRLSIPDEKARLIKLATDVYHNKMELVLSGYDTYEIATFPFQLGGLSDALTGRTDTLTYLFNVVLAQFRGLPLDTMNEKIKHKTVLFVKASAACLGIKQSFEDKIALIEDYQTVDEIEKHINLWAAKEGLF